MMTIRVRRLTPADRELARRVFAVMVETFEEESQPLGDAYLDRLLSRPGFWALAALDGDVVVGGLTAHTLPMTRGEESEIFIYDLAVHPRHQRRGAGRLLIDTLRAEAAAAGVSSVFVPADDEDEHAIDFYRATGGVSSPVTFFTYSVDRRGA